MLLYVPNYVIGRTRAGDGPLGDPVALALDGCDLHRARGMCGCRMACEQETRGCEKRCVSSSD